VRQRKAGPPGPLLVSLPGAGRLAAASLAAEVVVVEAEAVTRGRTGKRVAAAVRSGRTALRGKPTAAVGRPGLKTAGRHVNGSNREGWRRRWGKRSGRGDGGCGRPSGVMKEIRRGGQINRQQFTTVR
jgi:hypothetical protein